MAVSKCDSLCLIFGNPHCILQRGLLWLRTGTQLYLSARSPRAQFSSFFNSSARLTGLGR